MEILFVMYQLNKHVLFVFLVSLWNFGESTSLFKVYRLLLVLININCIGLYRINKIRVIRQVYCLVSVMQPGELDIHILFDDLPVVYQGAR